MAGLREHIAAASMAPCTGQRIEGMSDQLLYRRAARAARRCNGSRSQAAGSRGPHEVCFAPEGRPCGPKMQSMPGAISRGSLALHRTAARAARRYKAGQPWRSVVASPGIGGPPVRPEDARHSNRGVPRWPRLASEARPCGPKMQSMPTAAFRGGLAEHRSAACAGRMPSTGVSEGLACDRGTI